MKLSKRNKRTLKELVIAMIEGILLVPVVYGLMLLVFMIFD